ncbi:MAG: DNA/RNA nuclease SfsA [Desulfarculus sp.]|nr:MAG: DNA/RNA nuclease SfsA [Desulfarculus sp.]
MAGVCHHFPEPLLPGRLLRRYKRFLAEVELAGGERAAAHCPNSGSMLGCLEEGAPVMLSRAANPARSTRYTWEMIFTHGGWVGINTLLPNRLAALAAQRRVLGIFRGATRVRREVPVGAHTRLDLLVERPAGPLYLEVKNVTLVREAVALFPDAVTTRGARHLEALMELAGQGVQAAMVYVVQRGDAASFAPAQDIDPRYAELWRRAQAAGVNTVVLQAAVSPQRVCLRRRLPLQQGWQAGRPS